jgi:hypothetical protein
MDLICDIRLMILIYLFKINILVLYKKLVWITSINRYTIENITANIFEYRSFG